MTIIAIKDGIMAVDSRVSSDGLSCGSVKKWAEVSPCHGGGFVAGAGDASAIVPAVEGFGATGHLSAESSEFVHLRADGTVWQSNPEVGSWYLFEAPFFALGSGLELALGAMAAGATAEEAANICCEWDAGCGAPVHVLKI